MLTLPIKRKWFDMICRGEKREEYREPTDYWKERLFRARGRAPENEIPDPFHLKIFPIQIRAGYRQDSPTACLMVTIQFGKYGVPEWGADPDKEYIIIRILSVEDSERTDSVSGILHTGNHDRVAAWGTVRPAMEGHNRCL